LTLFGRRLAVSIPATVLEEKGTLRDRTTKVGAVARSCAVYGVDVIELFGAGDSAFIKKVLEYLETPQYLRRRLFPLDDDLAFAGALPPLRIPSHKPRLPAGKVRAGEIRDGVVNDDGTVDIGLDFAPKLKGGARPGARVTVKLVSVSPPLAVMVSRQESGEYWGYAVEAKATETVTSDERFDFKVATSRLGRPLGESLPAIRSSLRTSKGVKLIFGSPSRGLFDIWGPGLPAKVDLVANLFPEQRVETVRTEEAIDAALALINFLSAEKA
jgi:methyltransferase